MFALTSQPGPLAAHPTALEQLVGGLILLAFCCFVGWVFLRLRRWWRRVSYWQPPDAERTRKRKRTPPGPGRDGLPPPSVLFGHRRQ